MQITTITYGRTFSLRPYESERIDLTATIDAGDDPTLAALHLKAQVLRLGGDERGARMAQDEAGDRAAELAEGRVVAEGR